MKPLEIYKSSGFVYRAENRIRLGSIHQITILYLLNERFPEPVPQSILLDHMYQGSREPEWSENIIRVTISSMRKRIAPLGVKVVSYRGLGYALVEEEMEGL